MRLGIKGRCLGAVQIGVLPICYYLSYFRRGNDLPASLRGRFYRLKQRRLCRNGDFSAVAGRRVGLGLAKRSVDVEVNKKERSNGAMEDWSNANSELQHSNSPFFYGRSAEK